MEMRLLLLQLQVSIAVILILALRQGMKKLPKIYSYLLWILIFGRLLCPVALESRIGFMPSAEESARWMGQVLTDGYEEVLFRETERGTQAGSPRRIGMAGSKMVMDSGSEQELAGEAFRADSADLADQKREGEASDNKEGTAWTLAVILVWAAGVLGVLGYNAVALVRVRRKLRGACPLKDVYQIKNVYICRNIRIPFTMGMFHPRIYLPENMEGAELEYVLCHEGVHVRRKDYLVKNLAFLLTALNWFNPFVWTAFHFLESDMEMSCDEKVVKLMGADIKRQYSQSLLNFAVERGRIAVTPLTFGENNVKNRIKNVLSYKNTRKWSLVLGIAVCFVIGVTLFTTRAEGSGAGGDGQGQIPYGNGDAQNGISDRSGADGDQSGNPDAGGSKGGNTGIGSPSGESPDSGSVNGGNSGAGNTDSKGEVYWSGDITVYGQHQTPEEVTVEICQDGIYRADGGERICLYSGYISPELCWCDEGGILYFTVDYDYEEGNGDYLADRVCRVDLMTGESDKETLRIDGEPVSDKDIHIMYVAEGFVIMHMNESADEIMIPLVNTGNTPLTAGHIWKGKAVADLNEDEQDAFGMAVRKQLLDNPGLLVELSNRTLNETFALLDMDGDGRAERITLSKDPNMSSAASNLRIYDAYQLQAGSSRLTGQADYLSNYIWAFSPDGSRIVLALYADKDGVEPETILFSYDDGEIREIGRCQDDVRYFTVENGIIKGSSMFYDTLMPLCLEIHYQINQEGILELIPQEIYDFMSCNGELLVDLPLHDSPNGEEIHVMEPQSVCLMKIDKTFQWIYLEGKEGGAGWFKLDGDMRDHITELDMDANEVFELFYAG